MNKSGQPTAEIMNYSTFDDYMYRARKIATARFKWINTPDTWDTDFIENGLYDKGVMACIWDNNYKHMITRVNQSGELNIYDIPTRVTCYTTSQNIPNTTRYVYTGIKEGKSCAVLIKNNPTMTPTLNTIQLFCLRLAETERTMDTNRKQQKTPSMILGTQKQRLTLLNLYQQYDGNQPFIFGDKNSLGDTNLIRSIDTGAPYLLDKLTEHKQSIWCEMLSFLGINNVNYEKKERLITDEANANNHFINLNIWPEYNARKKACKQINDYFGLNIDVEINNEDIIGESVKNNVESGEKDE